MPDRGADLSGNAAAWEGRMMGRNENPLVACRVVGPLATNAYIVHCTETDKALIVDPGGDPHLISSYIEEKGLEPLEIVVTHGHSDHIAAVAQLKKEYGIGFAIHEEDREMVKLSVREAPYWGMGSIEEPEIDRTLGDGDTIEIGKARGTVLHTPGHSPGGISLHFGRFVIVGDTLFNRSVGRTDLQGGSMDTLLGSIRNKLFTLPDETIVYCGHGPATTIGEERRANPFAADYR
jgi:hydroxyacylglutathione hydrolase